VALLVRRSVFWNACATAYDALTAFEPYRRTLEQVAQALPPASPSTLALDAGTGAGNLALLLGSRGWNVIGADFSPAMLARAERKRRRAGARSVHYLRADLGGPLPFPNGAFDCVVSVHTLYLLKDRPSALRELRRVLKDGGVLVVSELVRPVGVFRAIREGVRREGWRRTAATCLRLAPVVPFLVPLNAWLNRKTAMDAKLAEELASAGFKVESVEEVYAAGAARLAVCRKAAVAPIAPCGEAQAALWR
jgi:ubiquinone/menaquinone biosynthesis C-methylase UbiE